MLIRLFRTGSLSAPHPSHLHAPPSNRHNVLALLKRGACNDAPTKQSPANDRSDRSNRHFGLASSKRIPPQFQSVGGWAMRVRIILSLSSSSVHRTPEHRPPDCSDPPPIARRRRGRRRRASHTCRLPCSAHPTCTQLAGGEPGVWLGCEVDGAEVACWPWFCVVADRLQQTQTHPHDAGIPFAL